MARFVDAVELPLSAEEAFDSLADFTSAAEWDPGVVSATKLSSGPPRLHSRFEVVVGFLGQRVPFVYQIEAYERPHRLEFRGRSESVLSHDVITLAETSSGTRLSYVASLEVTGIRRLADPLLNVLFQQIGRLAIRGLREHLATKRVRQPLSSPQRDHLAPPVAPARTSKSMGA